MVKKTISRHCPFLSTVVGFHQIYSFYTSHLPKLANGFPPSELLVLVLHVSPTRRKYSLILFKGWIQQCFICRPSDSTVSEDAGIEHWTVATLALTARRSNHHARSHPHSLHTFWIFWQKRAPRCLHYVNCPIMIFERSPDSDPGALPEKAGALLYLSHPSLQRDGPFNIIRLLFIHCTILVIVNREATVTGGPLSFRIAVGSAKSLPKVSVRVFRLLNQD